MTRGELHERNELIKERNKLRDQVKVLKSLLERMHWITDYTKVNDNLQLKVQKEINER